MKRYFLFVFLVTCTLGQVWAQAVDLQVRVLDASTGEGIVGATVFGQMDSSYCITDINGSCTLHTRTGKQSIRASLVGYDLFRQDLVVGTNNADPLLVRLQEATNLLKQTTVTAGRYEKPLGEVTVSLDVIKPAFFENTNSVSMDKALDRVPGVNIIDGQPNIRGGSGFSYGAGSRVLVLMDDLPALQADAGFPNWNDFPMENISQVEIVKGAASALYGSSALNGIINIRTGFAKAEPETQISVFTNLTGRPADDQKRWWGRDTSELGIPIETGASFIHRRKSGKWDLNIGGFGLYEDSYQRQTYRRYARLTPNLRYQVNDRLSVGLNTNFNIGKSASFFIWGGDSTLAFQPGVGAISQSTGRLRYTIDPYITYYDKAGNRHKLLNRYYSIRNRNIGNQSNSSDSWYSEYQIQRKLDKYNLVLTGGLVGNFTTVTAELYGDTSYTIRTAAAYMQLEQKLFDRLSISAGARYERNALFSPEEVDGIRIPNGRSIEGKPVFRLGANYQFAEATFVRASFGQGYRYPTIAEKFVVTGFGAGNSVAANPELVSETGWSAELGVKQGFKIGTWMGFADAAVFVSEYQRMMEFVVDTIVLQFTPTGLSVNTIFQSKNIGDTRISGAEFSVLGQGTVGQNKLSLMAGYTYMDPRYKTFGEYEKSNTSDTTQNVLKYRFRHTFKMDADFQVKRWHFGTNINYFSFMEAVDLVFDIGLPGVHQFRENHRTGTFLLDARVGYDITKEITALFICRNILNEEYQTRPALMGQPINYNLRFDWKF